MASTLVEWSKRVQNDFTAYAFKTIATTDEFLGAIQFKPQRGESFSYLREKALGSFGFIAPAGSVTESTGSDELVTVPKRIAVADYYLDNFADAEFGSSEEQNQTVKKLKAAGRMLGDKLINGGYITGFTLGAATFGTGPYIDALVANGGLMDSTREGAGLIKYTNSGTTIQFQAPGDKAFGPAVTAASDGNYTVYSDNPSKWITVTLDVSDATGDLTTSIVFTSTTNEFDGIKVLCPAGQVRASTAADGDPLTLGIMEATRDLVKTGGQKAFVGNLAMRRKLTALLRAAGGATVGEFRGQQVAMFDGIPFLASDFIASTESKGSSGSTLSSLYCVDLSDEGVWMGACGGEMTNLNVDPRATTALGFRIRDIGQIEGKDSAGKRISFYGGLALASSLGMSRAKEIIVA